MYYMFNRDARGALLCFKLLVSFGILVLLAALRKPFVVY